MKISAKTEYACLAMLELASGYSSGEPVRIRKIASEHGIPSRFLVQILLQLKGAGLVVSTRGASGGYQLARPPAEITLGTVMSAIDGGDEQFVSSAQTDSPMVAELLSVWQQAAAAQREALDSVTLAELLERASSRNESMFYI